MGMKERNPAAWEATELHLANQCLAAAVRDVDTLTLRKRRPPAKSMLVFYVDVVRLDRDEPAGLPSVDWRVPAHIVARALLESMAHKDWRAPLRTCVDTLRKRITSNEERIERLSAPAEDDDAAEPRLTLEQQKAINVAADPNNPMGYPQGWPRCPSCGDYAMDGKRSCGRAGH
jgi:hypothetical protein